MVELIFGIIIGLLLALIANTFSGNWRGVGENYKEYVENIFKGKGYIAGLSEEEENFKNSLKEKEDTKIS